MVLVGGVKKERKEVGRRVRYLLPLDPACEVGFGGVVQVEQRLGKGAFVFRGTATNVSGGMSGPQAVATKTLRGRFGLLFLLLPSIHFRLFTQLSTCRWWFGVCH